MQETSTLGFLTLAPFLGQFRGTLAPPLNLALHEESTDYSEQAEKYVYTVR